MFVVYPKLDLQVHFQIFTLKSLPLCVKIKDLLGEKVCLKMSSLGGW